MDTKETLSKLRVELTRHRAAMTALGMPPATTLEEDVKKHVKEGMAAKKEKSGMPEPRSLASMPEGGHK
jgi:hypothetical protein